MGATRAAISSDSGTAADTADGRVERGASTTTAPTLPSDQDVERDLPQLGRRIGANDDHSAGAKESSLMTWRRRSLPNGAMMPATVRRP
jgi:hypothetical protein